MLKAGIWRQYLLLYSPNLDQKSITPTNNVFLKTSDHGTRHLFSEICRRRIFKLFSLILLAFIRCMKLVDWLLIDLVAMVYLCSCIRQSALASLTHWLTHTHMVPYIPVGACFGCIPYYCSWCAYDSSRSPPASRGLYQPIFFGLYNAHRYN